VQNGGGRDRDGERGESEGVSIQTLHIEWYLFTTWDGGCTRPRRILPLWPSKIGASGFITEHASRARLPRKSPYPIVILPHAPPYGGTSPSQKQQDKRRPREQAAAVVTEWHSADDHRRPWKSESWRCDSRGTGSSQQTGNTSIRHALPRRTPSPSRIHFPSAPQAEKVIAVRYIINTQHASAFADGERRQSN